MHFKNFILVGFLSFVCTVGAFAQDFHYTQYFHSPLGVNPALAGAFNGSYRINGVVRDQYRGSANKAFSGFSLNVDAPIVRGIRKQDWIGIGLRMEQATAGNAGQKINFFGLGASYHLSLDKKQTQILSLGAQYGTGGYSYNSLNLEDNAFGSFLATKSLSQQASDFKSPSSGGGGGGGGSATSRDGGSLSDASVGLLYNSKNIKNGTDFKIGVSVEGILNPDRSANIEGNTGQDNKGIGINAFSSYEFEMTKRASLTSGIYYYTNKKASAVNVNSILNYKMKPGNALTLHAGLGLRNVRAGLIYLGASVKDIRVGLAYDLDISSATTASNGHGGVELAVSYIGKIFKKPKPKPIIYCPRL
ncbi:MAG: type IX secretion system PorP/SprF family membrane protein [Saprospiraceae bacterium]|jgi:type IX secretion system PorP/SprF family membrane protein